MPTSSKNMACWTSQCDLLQWNDIKKSGGTFAAGLLVLYLLNTYTLLGIFSNTLFYLTTGCLIWVVIKQVLVAFQGNSSNAANQVAAHPFQVYLDQIPKYLSFSDEQTTKYAKDLTNCLNKTLSKIMNLVLAKSLTDSATFVTFLYFTSGIFARFELLSLINFAWICAFTVPKVYKMFQKEIDEAFDKAWEPVKPHVEKISEIVNKYKNASAAVASSGEDKDE